MFVMESETVMSTEGTYPLIGDGDPPPFTVVNADGAANVLLVADHASCAFPSATSASSPGGPWPLPPLGPC